jgi:hypothetical protein
MASHPPAAAEGRTQAEQGERTGEGGRIDSDGSGHGPLAGSGKDRMAQNHIEETGQEV